MKKLITLFSLLTLALSSQAQTPPCDPALVAHYNMGDFPFTSSSGVTVTMAGTNSGTLGPYGQYGCSPALCDANTIRLDPGDTLIFNFSQTVFDFTFVSGVMNTTENGQILTNGGTPVLTSNCPTDLQITGNAFNQIGPLASPVITVSIPGGATSVSIVCLPASTNGVFTVDMLDCINESTPPCETTSSITDTACDSYISPSGNYTWMSSGIYMDTIPNAAGCDSVMTFDLTINNSSTGIDQQVACDSYTWIDGNTYTSSTSQPTFTLTNAAGCDSVVTLDLTINTVNVSVTQAGEVLTADETGATYQWLDCETQTAISGATNQTFTATANGSYAVEVTKDGCTDTSACSTVSGIGIIENDFGTSLVLFPNPTDGNFTVDLGANYQNVNIRLLDLSGKLIESNNHELGQAFDMTINEPAGVYLVHIEAENRNAIIRLVKE
jgi:hypothetical protein